MVGLKVLIVHFCHTGLAYKDGRLKVGDELLEINGNVIHGLCHLNASALIKGVEGSRVTLIVNR